MLHIFKTVFSGKYLNQLGKSHPYILYAIAYLGVPLGIILSVFAITYLVITPYTFLISLV